MASTHILRKAITLVFGILLVSGFMTPRVCHAPVNVSLKRIPANSDEVKGLRRSVANPSSQSLNVSASIVGRWTFYQFHPGKTVKGITKSSLRNLTFRADGSVTCVYEGGPNNRGITNQRESYQIAHKGGDLFPGKSPNIIIERHKQDREVIILLNVDIDYDNRIPMELGEVLKFSDVDGNEYIFVKEKKTVLVVE